MGKNQRKAHHSVEFKLKVVQDILENNRSVAQVAEEIGVHRDTVNNWRKAYLLNGKEGLINSRSVNQTKKAKENKEIQELKKQLKEKELENEILKKFQAFLKENE
ncbi:transposase [Oceanobacillus salinisoli]|uniref:transposase n=1 Tax=Oceanobacillus salinisoli TaxID=2678611 RepID=UPI0012E12859|nr:transposase [Oceanobacillus salinisoli]